MSQKDANSVVSKRETHVQMAMYLGQKDVEARVIEWIRDSCKFMLDAVSVIPAHVSTVEHNREAKRLLKRQNDEWATVCKVFLTLFRALSVVFLISACSLKALRYVCKPLNTSFPTAEYHATLSSFRSLQQDSCLSSFLMQLSFFCLFVHEHLKAH
jgi:hypothetical protein